MYTELGLKDSHLIVTYIDKFNPEAKAENSLLITDLQDNFFGTFLCETWLGSKRKISFSPNINNEYWKDKISKITVLNNYRISNFFVTTLLYKISIDSTEIFLKKENNVSEIQKKDELIGSLLYETFPNLQNVDFSTFLIENEKVGSLPLLFNSKKKSFSRFTQNNIFSFLLFRPEKNSNEIIHGKRENVIAFLKKFDLISKSKFVDGDNVYIPYFSPEYIEAYFSSFQFGNQFTRILIGNSYPKENDIDYIEKGISILIEIDIWIFILQQTCTHIEAEPIYKESIQAFTISLMDKTDNLQTIKEYYRENHLRISSDLYNFELLLSDFNNHLNTIAIGFSENNNYLHELKEFLRGDMSKYYFWSYISRLTQEQKAVKNKLENLMGSLRKRSIIINENLNTFYLMQATDINIKLQRQIKMITWLAIIIGIFAIISTLFASELHDLFVQLLK